MKKHVKLTSFQALPRTSRPTTLEIENVETFPALGTIKEGLLCLYGAMETAEEISYRRGLAEKKRLDYYSVSIELKFGLRSSVYVSAEDIQSGDIKFLSADRMAADLREKLYALWHEWRRAKKLPDVKDPVLGGTPCFDRVDFLEYAMNQKPFKKLACLASRIDVGSRVVKYAVLRDDRCIEAVEAYGPTGTIPCLLPERIHFGRTSRQAFS